MILGWDTICLHIRCTAFYPLRKPHSGCVTNRALKITTANKNIDIQAEDINKPLSVSTRTVLSTKSSWPPMRFQFAMAINKRLADKWSDANSIKTSPVCSDPATTNHSSTFPEVRGSSYQALLVLNRNFPVDSQRKPGHRPHKRDTSLLCTIIVTHVEDTVINNPFRDDEWSYKIHTCERNLLIQRVVIKYWNT